ncbi:Metal-dependent hydrolase [Altererythrobacter epoxidivorans]|uniref:Metal-dependent hydrolase n=1 Tax=Altererythrobacter epoxidivorans TaxID=361183 RepID=A0A0M3TB62_9SPHN|nr:endonuclease/exonuclease/phosphatase family protein [Altererythrobacter epoxidivorans]ALE17976.1 Metal-dependent hydrolase [Altererythrobacter epoxidivorans]
MQLKFASYNIHKAVGIDRRQDPDRIITVLRELDADVIALQEADMRFGQRVSVLPRALLDDTPWEPVPVAKRRQSIGWHGNALLVRRSMQWVAAGALELPTLEPRGAAMAELVLDGCRLRVIGMHLDLSGFRRRDQIRSILSHLEKHDDQRATVLMGDFNQWGLRSGAMGEFAKGWQMLAPGASYPARRPIARLDRIVVSDSCRVIDGGVHHSALAAQASDHLPIWTTLKLPKK